MNNMAATMGGVNPLGQMTLDGTNPPSQQSTARPSPNMMPQVGNMPQEMDNPQLLAGGGQPPSQQQLMQGDGGNNMGMNIWVSL